VDESRLNEQSQWVVYGAALAASCLSTAMMHPVDTVKVRKQALGAQRAAAAAAGVLFTEAAETSAVAVASAAAVAGMLAVDAKVAAAAEAPYGSFDTFDDGKPYTFAAPDTSVSPENVGSVGPWLDDAMEGTVSTRATATAPATATAAAAARGVDAAASSRGDFIVRRASASFDFDDDDGGGGGIPSSTAFAVAEMPGTAALGALALTAAEPDEIFPPLGVPLTPAGLLSLYDGLLPNLVKEGPPLALYLGIYEALKATLLQTELRDQPILCYLVAGAVGELVGSFLRVPAEAIKSTQQSNAEMSVGAAMAANFGDAKGRENTVKAWQVAVVRDVPFGAIQIALFEALKIWLAGMDQPFIDGDSLLGEAILGAIGGGVGSFISAPADVVVTRIIKQQTSGGGGDDALSPMEMVQEIWDEGGARAFFRGSSERVIYWAPAIGIFLTAYCEFRHLMLG
jgi:hypothetical protein